jgi:diketogulonate reductase-like aldo/keto reductase
VLYHLASRGIEYDLLPWQRDQQIPVMAYCPLAQAGTLRNGLVENKVVREISDQYHITPYQLLLAWCIRNEGVLAIPKASSKEHVIENAAASLIELTEADLKRLNDVFPQPSRKLPLDIV